MTMWLRRIAAALCMTCYGTGDWINPKTGNVETCPTCLGSGRQ